MFQSKITLHIKTNHNFFVKIFKNILIFLLLRNKLTNLKLKSISQKTKTKKFSILKSPFVHKTAWTQLEIRTIQQTIIISNFTKKEFIKIQKILEFLKINLPVHIHLTLKYTLTNFI